MGDRPRYRELPEGRAGLVYGPGDQLGCLNLLTAERTADAAALVKDGDVYSLNASLNWPSPGFFGSVSSRGAPRHVVIKYPGLARDDYFDAFYPQSGSQWDGFLHIGDPERDCFYNGNTDEGIGVDVWAERGIAGRGVLLDVGRWRERAGRPVDWRQRDEISVDELEQCARDQGVEVREGTILLVRVGWETGWNAATYKERMEVSLDDGNAVPGLEASPSMVERLWDWGVAAVASDNATRGGLPASEWLLHARRPSRPVGRTPGRVLASRRPRRRLRFEGSL